MAIERAREGERDVRLLGQNKRVKKIRVSMDHVFTLRFIVDAVFTNKVARNLKPSSSSSSSKASTFAPNREHNTARTTGHRYRRPRRGSQQMIQTTYEEHCAIRPRSVDNSCCTPSFRPMCNAESVMDRSRRHGRGNQPTNQPTNVPLETARNTRGTPCSPWRCPRPQSAANCKEAEDKR